MKTVAAAIREDLTRVKDVLDIFVRKGATQVEDLAPQLEMLRKISDTLGVLGLGALRTRVEGELESLKAIVERRIAPDDAALLERGGGADRRRRQPRLAIAAPDTARQRWGGRAGRTDGRRIPFVQDAVLRECIVNMARIKEAVTQSLSAPAEAQGLDQVPQLVRGITAGLLMLGKQRAVEVMEGIGRALGTIVRPDAGSLAPLRLEKLADAIVAVEYYMETLQAGRADQWHMLDGAEARLAELEPSGRVIPWPEPRAAEMTGTGRRVRYACRHDRCTADGDLRNGPAGTARRRPAAGACSASACRCGDDGGSGVPCALRRGSPRERYAPERLVPALGAEPARCRGAARRASRIPHAERQRPHGGRAARRRIFVEHRDAAESRDQPDIDAVS